MSQEFASLNKESLLKMALEAGHQGISRYTKTQLMELLSKGGAPRKSQAAKPKAQDLDSLSRKELQEMARKAGIQGVTRSTKVDLIALLKGRRSETMQPAQKKAALPSISPSGLPSSSPSVSENPVSAPRHPMAEREPSFATADAVAQEAQFGVPAPEHREAPGGPFPDRYERNFVTLLVKDPYWLHAYWEVRQDTYSEVLLRCGGSGRSIIRVYEAAQHTGNGSSNPFFDVEVSGGAHNWYIHGGNPGASFYVEYGLLAPDGAFHAIVRSSVVATPRHAPSHVEDEEWISLPGGFEQIYALSGGGRIGMGSLEMREMMEKRFREELSSGGVSSFGSGALGRPRERGFWMVVNTELVVYGATEPDASVTVQGHPITLRPDGTFTMRFSLPDGVQHIPVEGTSADGLSTRTITPSVEKTTTSSQVEREEVYQ